MLHPPASASRARFFPRLRRGFVVGLLAAALPLLSAQSRTQDGTVDPAFDPGAGPNGAVLAAAAQPDGKVIVGGQFTQVGDAPRHAVARLNADGSLDADFHPRAGTGANVVRAVALQPDGKALIGGDFTQVNGVSRPGLARLNADGSLDAAFDPSQSFVLNQPSIYYGDGVSITSLAIQPDGKIIVGGGLVATINGQGVIGFARLNADGSLDPSFNVHDAVTGIFASSGGNNYQPHAIALQPDGKVLMIGTAFLTGVTRGEYYPYFCRFNADGSRDGSFLAHLSLYNALAAQPDGKLLVAGRGKPMRFNADGTQDASYAPEKMGDPISAVVAQPDGRALIGGSSQATVSRLNADGGVDSSFDASAAQEPGAVKAFAFTPDGKSVIVAGQFTAIGGTPRVNVARLIDIPRQINSPATAEGVVGSPFAYQITASSHPASYAAAGLPAGLSLDPATGLISGAPTAAGAYMVLLEAANAQVTPTRTLALTVTELPVVTLTATAPEVTAGSGEQGRFTLQMSGARDQDVYVNLTIKGSAVNGEDYALVKATKKIKAGKTSKPIKIIPLGGGAGPGGKRTVTLTLAPGEGYTAGTTGKAKVRIDGQ